MFEQTQFQLLDNKTIPTLLGPRFLAHAMFAQAPLAGQAPRVAVPNRR